MQSKPKLHLLCRIPLKQVGLIPRKMHSPKTASIRTRIAAYSDSNVHTSGSSLSETKYTQFYITVSPNQRKMNYRSITEVEYHDRVRYAVVKLHAIPVQENMLPQLQAYPNSSPGLAGILWRAQAINHTPSFRTKFN